MNNTFCEYYEVRLIDDLLEESFGDLMHGDVGELARDFLHALSRHLPYGIRSLPTQATDSIKDVLMKIRLRGVDGIDVDALSDQPNYQQISQAVNLIGGDEKVVGYYLGLFNKKIKSTINPGVKIDPNVYYRQFKNFMQNPSLSLDKGLLMRQSSVNQPNPDQVLQRMAQSVKSSTNDPTVQVAADRALHDLISDTDMRSLAWEKYNTKSGKEVAGRILQPYGATYDDFRNQIQSSPELKQRFSRARRDKYNFNSKNRSVQPVSTEE